MDFMTYEQKMAFVEAVQDNYGIDTKIPEPEKFLKETVHYCEYSLLRAALGSVP